MIFKTVFSKHIATLTDLLKDPDVGAVTFAEVAHLSDVPVPQLKDAINSGLMFKLKFQVEPSIKTLLPECEKLKIFIAEVEKKRIGSVKDVKDMLEVMRGLIELVNDTYSRVGEYIEKRVAVVKEMELNPQNEGLRRQIVKMDKMECFTLSMMFCALRLHMLSIIEPH